MFHSFDKMSDFEDDDMDIDGPPPSKSVQFGSNNTDAKGKRIVADLPVEAQDNLPWFAHPTLLPHLSYILLG